MIAYLGFLNKSNEAIEEYSNAIRIKPDFSAAFIHRGDTYRKKKELDIAISDYSEVINGDFHEKELAYLKRGKLYIYEKKDYMAAINDLTQVINVPLNNDIQVDALIHRGETYLNITDFDKALADFNQAIRLKPNFAESYYYRAKVYHPMNDITNIEKALKELNRAIELDSKFYNAFVERSNIHLSFGNLDMEKYGKSEYEKAIADLSSAIEINPNLPDAFIKRSDAYIKYIRIAKLGYF
jgi:tetratricopeptide (TPR) repeat protein